MLRNLLCAYIKLILIIYSILYNNNRRKRVYIVQLIIFKRKNVP